MRTEPNDFLIQVLVEYENRLGKSVDMETRLRDHVEHRCALANAARAYCTYAQLGGLFGKDHSSIVHYHREHEGLLLYAPQYRRKFAIAMQATNHVASILDQVPIKHRSSKEVTRPQRRIEEIDEIIHELEVLKERIIESKIIH